MNILYLSCHSILEYDEVKLFANMGHNVRAIGSYTNPHSPGDPKRPPVMTMEVNDQHISLANRFHQDNLQQETLDWADVIVFMHMPDWIKVQLNQLKQSGKHIVFRSIGQSSPQVERDLQIIQHYLLDKFHVIKYSPSELLWEPNANAEAIIPFYKDLTYGWRTEPYCKNDLVFCVQAAKRRGDHCHFADVEEATRDMGLKRLLLGPTNEDSQDVIETATPDYADLKRLMCESKLLIYCGTIPAAYTLVPIEAMMLGVPMITISDSWYRTGHEFWVPEGMFDIPKLLPTHVAENPEHLQDLITSVINHPSNLMDWSREERHVAKAFFGEDLVADKWQRFFGNLNV